MEATNHQKNVRQILEGNERVYFHPSEELLAVWHGGPQIQIVNSKTWENTDVITVKTAERDIREIERSVDTKLVRMGYDRRGRTSDKTQLVEK